MISRSGAWARTGTVSARLWRTPTSRIRTSSSGYFQCTVTRQCARARSGICPRCTPRSTRTSSLNSAVPASSLTSIIRTSPTPSLRNLPTRRLTCLTRKDFSALPPSPMMLRARQRFTGLPIPSMLPTVPHSTSQSSASMLPILPRQPLISRA